MIIDYSRRGKKPVPVRTIQSYRYYPQFPERRWPEWLINIVIWGLGMSVLLGAFVLTRAMWPASESGTVLPNPVHLDL
jgi:hypothetical protein